MPPRSLRLIKALTAEEHRGKAQRATENFKSMANKSNPKALATVVENLRAAHGDNLASIVLYGSAAAGDHVAEHSDHNLLIALKRITSEDLRLSQNAMRDW